MSESPYEKAVALLGNEAVLIPIATGSKKPPRGHAWENLSLADAQKPEYVAVMAGAAAVAALLGPVSCHLVAIDFDVPEAAEQFLALNPALEGSLRTHGRRGCVLWVKMAEDYPARCVKLRDPQGQHLGEWRAGSCYSIISGEHKDGGQYKVLVEASPALCRFEDITWPQEWQNTPKLSEQNPHAMQKGNQKNVIESACTSACTSAWQSKPALSWSTNQSSRKPVESLYDQFIAHYWNPAPNQRNDFISDGIPFLFTAMSEDAVLPLVMEYHTKNRDLFKDSAEQHRHEAVSHLRAVAARYQENLIAPEQAKYDSLRTERERAAFRICRHLSKHESVKSDCEGDQFFLSYEDLGNRLQTNPKSAHRLMKTFIRLGIVEIIRKGQKRMPGIRGRATVWRYLF